MGAHSTGAFSRGADAALAASIFHYRTHSIAEVKKFLKENAIHVRIIKLCSVDFSQMTFENRFIARRAIVKALRGILRLVYDCCHAIRLC
jgi:hypothetical protein